MALPFITRQPTEKEVLKIQLLMSTYTDGAGYEKAADGVTRPGWRDLERVVAEFWGENAPENKGIFDVVVSSDLNDGLKYGVSVKSKAFTNSKYLELNTSGRVYMELTNSPAKLWAPLKAAGIDETAFRKQTNANEVGKSVLETVHSWYERNGHQGIVLSDSIHLTVSYTLFKDRMPSYQFHAFPLNFPEGINWVYKSERCLSGYDPSYPNEVLFDWYGLSGGQLKYYPKVTTARYSSPQFELLRAPKFSIADKAEDYWPNLWED